MFARQGNLAQKSFVDFSVLGHTNREVIIMAKQGMKRPDRTHTQPRNQTAPVPELQGAAKTGKAKAKPQTEP